MKDRKIEGQWRCEIWHVGTGIYKDCARVDRDFGIQIFVYFRRSSFFSAAFGGSGEIGIVICVFFHRFMLGFVSFLFIALRSVGPREHVAQN